MPTISYTDPVPSAPLNSVTVFEKIGDYTLTFVSNTSIVLTSPTGIISYVLKGFDITGSPGVGVVSGTITSMKEVVTGKTYTTISDLNLSAIELFAAAEADSSGANTAALEFLLLPLGYTFRGKDNIDYLPVNARSADGVFMNFFGDDVFNTAGGDDNVWLGHGNDTARGGDGHDTFFGDLGDDRLFGEAGRDSLVGGEGKDKFIGGINADTLTGDGGRDTFVFALGDGRDVITDFAVSSDKIDLPTGSDHAFATSGADTILYYGLLGDQILLVGIDAIEAAAVQII